MNSNSEKILEKLFHDSPELLFMKNDIIYTINEAVKTYTEFDGKIISCGNGGSAADSLHITGELMKGFRLKRELTEKEKEYIRISGCPDPDKFASSLQRGLRAMSLVSETSLITAYINDCDPDMVFAQQTFAYGKRGDILLALSTSGNSLNIINASFAAKARKMKVISFTGKYESSLSEISDVTFRAPSDETYRIQEYHIMIYHALCACIESEMFL